MCTVGPIYYRPPYQYLPGSSDPGSHSKLCPPPHHGSCLHFCSEKASAVPSFVNSSLISMGLNIGARFPSLKKNIFFVLVTECTYRTPPSGQNSLRDSTNRHPPPAGTCIWRRASIALPGTFLAKPSLGLTGPNMRRPSEYHSRLTANFVVSPEALGLPIGLNFHHSFSQNQHPGCIGGALTRAPVRTAVPKHSDRLYTNIKSNQTGQYIQGQSTPTMSWVALNRDRKRGLG